jgi:hypothetical protein
MLSKPEQELLSAVQGWRAIYGRTVVQLAVSLMNVAAEVLSDGGTAASVGPLRPRRDGPSVVEKPPVRRLRMKT